MTMLPEPTEVMPTRKPATRPMSDIHANDFMVGGFAAARSSIFFWKNKKVGMQISRTPTADRDEVVDAIAVDVAQVNQETYAQIRARSAADDQRHDHLAPHRAFAQMDDAGADLGREVEERVGANGAHGRHVQTENENREQQNAAPDSRHSDEGPDSKTHQALDQQIHISSDP